MGSLFNKPKAPAIVYKPEPIAEDVVEPTQEIVEDTSVEDEAVERAKAVVKSKRGKMGTIRTSTRGVFSLSDLIPKRKSLLGE